MGLHLDIECKMILGEGSMENAALIKVVRDICLQAGEDAREMAKKADVALYDVESYISGYQDCAVDIDEAIRKYMLRHDAESKPIA
jgi:hypothetical protein